MKKVAFILLVAVIFSLSGCSTADTPQNTKSIKSIETNANDTETNSQSDISDTANAPADTLNNDTQTAEISQSISEQVLLDQDGIKITAKGIEDSWLGTNIKILVENDSNTNVTVQTRDSTANGIMIDTMCSVEVLAGKKANDSITFVSSSMEIADIKILKNISFKLHIFNSESWDTIYDSDQITLIANEDVDYTQKYDDSGIEVLNRDGFRILAKELDNANSFWGADLYLYIENTSGSNATIQVRNVSINGFMVDPMFSCDILNGMKAFDEITFMDSDLENNGITDITNLELSFHIFKTDSWDTILDTDVIKIDF